MATDPAKSLAPPSHQDMANALRALAMDAVEAAKSGHPGMPMGMADVATVLFTQFLKFNASDAAWPDRDRFVLSAGHGSMLLYGLLHLTGYPGVTIEEIRNFRQLGAKTAGHPEFGHMAGIETTTGPLGQGFANAVGMALGERLMNARHGDGLCDHYTYCIAGDGCLMEGISHEALSLAGHLKLGRLIVLFDDNHISIDGPTDLSVSDDQGKRFSASGWHVQAVDGHDPLAIAAAITAARAVADRPSMIACRTTIGYGAPKKQGTSSAHGSPLGPDEIAGTRAALGWDYPPFVIPDAIVSAWRTAGKRGEQAWSAWQARWREQAEQAKVAWVDPVAVASIAIEKAIVGAKQAATTDTAKRATRIWSEMTLDKLVLALPELIGGSADLTGSNNTKAKSQKPVKPDDYAGSYVYWGVREHAMAAAMNGIALHGGFIPYGGTFLVFADYCRPAIRLSALMGQRVIYVMTHDSIGLGEDGPTHQPVEHLASLRAIPNLQVFRPADGVETAECWQLAVMAAKTPSILALTRQAVPNLRRDASAENRSAKGGYVLTETKGARDVTLIATGSEVGLAVDAADTLAAQGINAAVVSLPSFELFRAQPVAYRSQVLGTAPRIGIEAGIAQGWHEWLRLSEGHDAFIGLSGFGASAPGPALFEHFGVTPKAVVTAAKALVKK